MPHEHRGGLEGCAEGGDVVRVLHERGRHGHALGHVAFSLPPAGDGVAIVAARREVVEPVLAPAPRGVVRSVDEDHRGLLRHPRRGFLGLDLELEADGRDREERRLDRRRCPDDVRARSRLDAPAPHPGAAEDRSPRSERGARHGECGHDAGLDRSKSSERGSAVVAYPIERRGYL